MNDDLPPDAGRVLAFWFEELEEKDWWAKNDDLDARIRREFTPLLDCAAKGGLADWADTPETCLALIILLDQFSRNIHRDRAEMYAADALARRIAGAAVDRGFDRRLPAERRFFLYMPFEHSEDAADQARSVSLFTALGHENYLNYALAHKRIVDRFGRFPHRNAILGRTSTPEEEAFLKEPGSTF